MTKKRIDLDASETGPVLGAIVGYLEAGSVDEMVVSRDGKAVARLTRIEEAPGGAVAPAVTAAAVATSETVAETTPENTTPRYSRPERQRRSLRGTLAGLLLVAVAAFVLTFVLAPVYAFFALRSAALTSDAPALEELVDYSETRASLRPQLSRDPRADEPAPSWIENPVEAVRRTFEGVMMPDPQVDRYLTPTALAGLSFGEGRYAAERSSEGAPLIERSAMSQPWPSLVHWGFSRARFRVRDEGGSATVLTFNRQGLFTWKLTHIGLPDGGLPSEPIDPNAVPPAG